MANTKFIEPGTSVTQGFELWSGTSAGAGASVTSDAQAVAGSARSIKINTGAGNLGAGAFATGAMADAGRRFSFYMRYNGTLSPATNASDFCSVVNTGAGIVFEIGLDVNGHLMLMNDSHTNLAVGTTVLVQNTDYRISCAYTITSTTVNTFTIYLNGVAEIVATNVTLIFTGGNEFEFFWRINGFNAGANLIMYGAHFYIDDGTSGDCGAGGLLATAKRDFTNGTTNGMTGSGTPSGYGTGNARYVNERPLNTSNFVSIVAVASAITEEYNIEGLSVGDNIIPPASGLVFDGSQNYLTPTSSVTNPNPMSYVIKFKTTTTNGGRIAGFGDTQTGASSEYDRHLYMTNDGKLHFGVFNGSTVICDSVSAYNDGLLHTVTCTFGAGGMVLNIDNVENITNANTSVSNTANKYFRLGYDNLTGWPGTIGSFFWAGTITQADYYARQLSGAEITSLNAGTAPTTTNLTISYRFTEGSGTTDADLSGNSNTGTLRGTPVPLWVTSAIVDYVGWVYAKALLSETGKIIVNNVQTNISLVNANTMFTKIAGSTTYPAGTGTDIGIVTATTATTISLYEAGIIVAYIPTAVTGISTALLPRTISQPILSDSAIMV